MSNFQIIHYSQFQCSACFAWYFQMGQWHAADEYDGQVREITFRSKCTSPMCPPDTAMTEYQHYVLSPDKKMLVWPLILSSCLNFLLMLITFLVSNDLQCSFFLFIYHEPEYITCDKFISIFFLFINCIYFIYFYMSSSLLGL